MHFKMSVKCPPFASASIQGRWYDWRPHKDIDRLIYQWKCEWWTLHISVSGQMSFYILGWNIGDNKLRFRWILLSEQKFRFVIRTQNVVKYFIQADANATLLWNKRLMGLQRTLCILNDLLLSRLKPTYAEFWYKQLAPCHAKFAFRNL